MFLSIFYYLHNSTVVGLVQYLWNIGEFFPRPSLSIASETETLQEYSKKKNRIISAN